jgi:hypothetical protein
LSNVAVALVLSYGCDSIALSIEEEVVSTNYVNQVVEIEPTEIDDLTVSGFITLLDEDHLQINIWSWVGDEWDIVSAEMKYRRDYGDEWRVEGVADLNWFGDEDLTFEMQKLWESICDSIDRVVRAGILFNKEEA